MQLSGNYFDAYRSLRLKRDESRVLVAEFHSDGGPFIFTTQDHTDAHNVAGATTGSAA